MLLSALREAVKLLAAGDPEVYSVIARSLLVSITGVAAAGLTGIPVGILLGLRSFPGKRLAARLIYVGMGLPPVLVGLVVFLLLSRSGPVGRHVYLLFTPAAMIIAQFLLALPIVAGLTMTAVEGKSQPILLTARGLGARGLALGLTLLGELRLPIVAGIVTAFGRVSAEVGAVMLVGGDIDGHTRVLTTAIMLETRQGHFELATALGLVLLAVSFLVNTVLHRWQHGRGM